MIKKNFFFSLLLVGVSIQAYAASSQYTVMIDAGSSGSKVHVFEYTDDGKVPVINDIFSEKVKPGLSSFANQPENAGASLKKLLDDAKQALEQHQVDTSQISVSVMATAGMRLLPEDKQEAIYQSVTNYIKSNYSFVPGEIETITGKMEALYGWLDVNYLTHTFEAEPYHTIGSLDMGGASTEIAYQTTDTTDTADETTLTINGKTYTVFSKSYLGLGMDQSFATMKTDANAASCFPANYPLSSDQAGVFNYANCKAAYKSIIDQFDIAGKLPAKGEQPFVAYSGYYYVFNFFGAVSDPSEGSLETKALDVCTMSWEQMKEKYPKEDEKYLATYCANASYMNELLRGEYQLGNGQLSVAEKIQDKDLDWTLGAVLYRLVK